MTGFGKSGFEINHKKVTVEIKSLNSKQADISTRIPSLYREKEMEIRKEISDRLVRGKIDFGIFIENLGENGNAVINEGVVKSYFSELSRISQGLSIPVNERLLQIVMRLPDTVKVTYETLEEEEWEILRKHIFLAFQETDLFRIREGKALEKDLRENLGTITRLLDEIAPYEQPRIENVRNRLTANLESLQLNGNIDANRFEQELIFYLERLDFNEEKVRLANHCVFFWKLSKRPNPTGKNSPLSPRRSGAKLTPSEAKPTKVTFSGSWSK